MPEEQPADDGAPGHDRHGQVAAHRTLGRYPRQAEEVGVPLVRDVVEEGPELGRRQFGGHVGGSLHDMVEFEVGGQHPAHLVQPLDDPAPLLQAGFGPAALGQVGLIEAPVDQAGQADAGDEEGVDPRPLPGVADRRRVVEDGTGIEGAEEPVVDEDIADGGEKGQPVLVEGDDDHHDKEVEMHLDQSAGEMHEHRRRRQQAQRRRHGADPAAQPPHAGDGGGGRNNQALGQAVDQREAHGQGDHRDHGRVEPEQDHDAPMPTDPRLLRQGAALRQEAEEASPHTALSYDHGLHRSDLGFRYATVRLAYASARGAYATVQDLAREQNR